MNMNPEELRQRNERLENEMKNLRLSVSKTNSKLISLEMKMRELKKLIDKYDSVKDALSYNDPIIIKETHKSLTKIYMDMRDIIKGA